MVDYFFSYKKNRESGKGGKINYNVVIDGLLEELAQKIAKKVEIENQEKTKKKVVKIPDKRSFKEILEEEVAKFDSIEEVKFLGEYLVNYWKELHLK